MDRTRPVSPRPQTRLPSSDASPADYAKALYLTLTTHVSVRMRTLIAARSWLTVIRLPAYAPDLNPTEGVWAWMKRGITNTAIHGVDHLAQLVKQRLRACQQQTDLIAGFLAQTG